MNINEGDADLGIGSIRSRVVGAGVNAESGRELSFSASDPLSELVYSSHKGLSLKFASSRTADKKPFLLWNVNKAWGTPPDDMFVDKAAHSDDSKSPSPSPIYIWPFESPNCSTHCWYVFIYSLKPCLVLPDLQAQKENNMLISPKSRALWDENDRSRDSAAGLKRQGYVKDVTHETKRIKNQIPLGFGSTSSWISNMGRSSIDVNLHQNFIDAQDSASLIFQSTLSCKDMNILNTGEEKEKDSIEESIQLMVDDNKTLSLSKQIIVCDNQARTPDESFAGQMNYADNQARSEKCKVIIQETSTSNLDSGMNVLFPTDEKNLESRDDSQVNQKCSTNTEVSVDVKSKFGSSEALAMRLGAFRHITPLENNVKNEYQKSPLYDIVPAQNTVKLSEIFQAIQNLRLSRADILR